MPMSDRSSKPLDDEAFPSSKLFASPSKTPRCPQRHSPPHFASASNYAAATSSSSSKTAISRPPTTVRNGRCGPVQSTARSPTAFAAGGAPRSTQTSAPSSKPRADDQSGQSTPSASPSTNGRCRSARSAAITILLPATPSSWHQHGRVDNLADCPRAKG